MKMKKEINFENVKDLSEKISKYLIEMQNNIDEGATYDMKHLPVIIHDSINRMFSNDFGNEFFL